MRGGAVTLGVLQRAAWNGTCRRWQFRYWRDLFYRFKNISLQISVLLCDDRLKKEGLPLHPFSSGEQAWGKKKAQELRWIHHGKSPRQPKLHNFYCSVCISFRLYPLVSCGCVLTLWQFLSVHPAYIHLHFFLPIARGDDIATVFIPELPVSCYKDSLALEMEQELGLTFVHSREEAYFVVVYAEGTGDHVESRFCFLPWKASKAKCFATHSMLLLLLVEERKQISQYTRITPEEGFWLLEHQLHLAS